MTEPRTPRRRRGTAARRPVPRDSPWTRPLQRVAAGYFVFIAVLSLILVAWAENPDRNIDTMAAHGLTPLQIQQHLAGYSYGVGAQIIESLLYLRIAWGCRRGRRWAFWLALVAATITGFGAFWVPLRPAAHAGLDTCTLIVHAFVNDLPGVLLALALAARLVVHRHVWAPRHAPVRRDQPAAAERWSTTHG